METFVVRVWRAADHGRRGSDEPETRLRGLAEHVGTGAETRFGSEEELLRFLRSTPIPSGAAEPGADRPSSPSGTP